MIPPERHGGLPEGAADKEGEGRERMAQSLASRVSQRSLKASNLIHILPRLRVESGNPRGVWDDRAVLAIIMAEEVCTDQHIINL